jgi:hypothetical protein
VFLPGLLGGLTTSIGLNVCPDEAGVDTCPQGTFERAEYVGRGAAEAAISSLEAPSAQITEAPTLAVRRRVFLASATNSGLALLVAAGVLPRQLFRVDGTPTTSAELEGFTFKDLSRPDSPFRVASEVNSISIGPVIIGTAPGELYAELWLPREDGSSFAETPEGADFPGETNLPPLSGLLPTASTKIIINNANDALGYIIPKPQWDTKKPYAYGETSSPQYGEENSVGHDMASTLYQAYERLSK